MCVCLCVTFFSTVIKIDAPHSLLPFPIACHPPASLACSQEKSLFLKYEFVENNFCFLLSYYVTVQVPPGVRCHTWRVTVPSLSTRAPSESLRRKIWQDKPMRIESYRCTASFWKHVFGLRCTHVQGHKNKHTRTPAVIRTHLCHLFTCYAGRSRLCVLWVSLWEPVAGRHFPEKEEANIKSMSNCFT